MKYGQNKRLDKNKDKGEFRTKTKGTTIRLEHVNLRLFDLKGVQNFTVSTRPIMAGT